MTPSLAWSSISLHLLLRAGDEVVFLSRDGHVGDGDAKTRQRAVVEAQVHQAVQQRHGLVVADLRVLVASSTRLERSFLPMALL